MDERTKGLLVVAVGALVLFAAGTDSNPAMRRNAAIPDAQLKARVTKAIKLAARAETTAADLRRQLGRLGDPDEIHRWMDTSGLALMSVKSAENAFAMAKRGMTDGERSVAEGQLERARRDVDYIHSVADDAGSNRTRPQGEYGPNWLEWIS